MPSGAVLPICVKVYVYDIMENNTEYPLTRLSAEYLAEYIYAHNSNVQRVELERDPHGLGYRVIGYPKRKQNGPGNK